MEAPKVIIVVICFVVLALALYYFFGTSSALSSMQNAQSMQTIQASSLPSNQGTNLNFAYSIWVYINDWQVNIGSIKVIFGRNQATSGNDLTDSSAGCIPNPDPNSWDSTTFMPCPIVYLDSYENNLGVSIVTQSSNGSSTGALNVVVSDNAVPIQKWTQIAISVYQTVLDIYIDGKLVSTNILEGPVFTIAPNTNLYITPCSGFSGWTSQLQYFSNPLNPQQVWDIYSQGYGGGFFSGSSTQNGITVTVNQNGVPTSSFSI
jgi:Concanavalin A-like lectin/glucanases superfamily